MKNAVKYFLQRLLGFKRYLTVFSVFKVYTLKWDKKENAFLHFINMLPNKGVLLDIGANIGVMSVIAAQKLNRVEVFAFEPIPNNLAVLKRTIAYFNISNVTVFDTALGNETGTVEMVMPVENNVKMQGLSHVVHSSIPERNEGDKFTVSVKRLDDILEIKNSPLPITAIKMDVENYEFFVLDGARQLLQNHKPIIYIELWENENRYKCFDLVKELGYTIKVLVNNSLVNYDANVHTTQNFFFV